MTQPGKLYDDEGLTPEQVQAIDDAIATHEANIGAPRFAQPDGEQPSETEAERGPFGDCVVSAKLWDEMTDTLFDAETMERFERGKKELERRGIDLLLMSPEALTERSQNNGGKLADAFHAGSENKVKTMSSLKIKPRTTFSVAFG